MFFKFLITVALVAIIWFGFQHLQRLAELRARYRHVARTQGAGASSGGRPSTVDLSQCPVCGTWQSGQGGACGRPDCPHRARR